MKNYLLVIISGIALNFFVFANDCISQWLPGAGLDGKSVYCMASGVSKLFAGTDISGVYFSIDNGQNWSQSSLNNREIHAIASKDSIILAGTFYYGVYISTNNGLNWTNTAIGNKMVNALYSYGSSVFAGSTNYPSGTGGVRVTTNSGESWTTINEGWMVYPTVSSLLISNGYLFAGIHAYSVWRRPLSEVIGISNLSSEVPSNYSVEQNYPNPFNPVTNIKFQVAQVDPGIRRDDRVVLKVFDLLGREVRTLVNEVLQPGTYQTTFDASNLSSGIYFYQLSTNDFSETKKLILLK